MGFCRKSVIVLYTASDIVYASHQGKQDAAHGKKDDARYQFNGRHMVAQIGNPKIDRKEQ